MKELTINYRNGHMTFYVDRYFPCMVNTARKVYPFICQYAKKEDLQMLMQYLENYKLDCEVKMINYARKANGYRYGSSQYRYYHARLWEIQTLVKRTNRNIEIFTNGGMSNA